MNRAGGTCQIVNLMDLQMDWLNHVRVDEFEVRMSIQLTDVGICSGEHIVQADYFISFEQQALAEVRADKPSSASN